MVENSSQAKVTQLDIELLVQKHISRLQISVQYLYRVSIHVQYMYNL